MSPQSTPEVNEYAPAAAGYVRLVPPGDVVQIMESQLAETTRTLRGLSEERGAYRYAPGKWSIKEIIGHMNDAERIFSYRALRIARADETPLPGFEQDDYVRTAGSNDRPLASLVDEFELLRRANILLFRYLPADAWTRMGTASNHPVSVRALARILVGHELHHVHVLREKYAVA